ncbi:hypothetical protein C8Q74DRAFT_1396776 [Fomes fomentarius]|nr:hypothetical protein C8Q74DRAFT_1396776 [Fomes fomentarius]
MPLALLANVLSRSCHLGNFRIAALVRPTSVSKATTEELRAVEICVGKLTDSLGELKKIVEGVTVLISAVSPMALEAQKEIFRAAKEAGVQRVIPCDFTIPVEKGVVTLVEFKHDIHQFIKDLGLGYIFIGIGWSMQLYLPPSLERSRRPGQTAHMADPL